MSLSCFSSATELTRAIRAREISAVEVLDLFLAQNDRLHGQVNAICTLDLDARKMAAQMDLALARGETIGPLHGLPVSFKDSFQTKGMRTTCGFPALADHVPDHDSTLAARVRQAGGIVFAKTNVPPLLSEFESKNEIFGRTNNPWNLDYSAGGSSGGSAAALAAGLTPFDLASDMFGSIRVPAHFCGVTGLKPTQFRISSIGHYPPLPGWPFAGNLIATRGPMARCIEDLLLVLPILAEADPRDPESLPMPIEEFPAKSPSQYRVAWTDELGGIPIIEDTRAILEKTALALERAGAHVEKVSVAHLDWERIWEAAGEVCTSILSYAMSPPERKASLDALLEEASSGPIQKGSYQGVQGNLFSFMRALDVRLRFISSLRTFFQSWDGWLLPTTCGASFLHEDYRKPVKFGSHTLPFRTALASHVSPFNLSGSPVVTFPAGFSSQGLPIGLQLVGEPWRDFPLLRLTQTIEGLIGPLPTAPIGGQPHG